MTQPHTTIDSQKLQLTDKEAANMLGIGKSTLWEMVRKKKAPAPVKLGGSTRWKRADILQHIEAMSTTTSSAPAAG